MNNLQPTERYSLTGVAEKQIPFGDDNKKNKGKNESRFPSGMTTRKATTKANAKSKSCAERSFDCQTFYFYCSELSGINM